MQSVDLTYEDLLRLQYLRRLDGWYLQALICPLVLFRTCYTFCLLAHARTCSWGSHFTFSNWGSWRISSVRMLYVFINAIRISSSDICPGSPSIFVIPGGKGFP